MDEYIKKNQALCCFSGWIDQNGDFHEPDEMIEYQRIEQLTASDVVPVVHGRWSGDFCSKCGISKYNFIKILHDDDGPFGTWNFCPKCGAKMDVGDGSTD